MKKTVISFYLSLFVSCLYAQNQTFYETKFSDLKDIIAQANQLTEDQEFDKVIALLISNEQKFRNAPSDFIAANDILLANAYYFTGQFEKSIPLVEKYVDLSIEDSILFEMQRPIIFILGMSYFYGGYLEKSDTLMSQYVYRLEQFGIKDIDYLLSLKTICYIQLLEDKIDNCCIKANDELLFYTDSISKLSDADSIKVPYIKNLYATVFDHDKYIDNWLSLNNDIFSSNLFSDLIKLDNQSRYEEVLYVTELYKDSLSNFYNPDSLLYAATLNMISNAYSRNIYENKDTVLWVEPFFKEIERTLSESNPNFFSIVGNCANVRNINSFPDKYLILLKRQLNYVRQNNIDTIFVVQNLISAYIKINQIDSALMIMQNIDENNEIPIEQKMFARFSLLTALLGNKTNSEYQSLFVIYANKYLGDFAQHNFEFTRDIIRWLIPICFETNNYTNLDNCIKIYENLPNISLREIEDLYDMISTSAEFYKLWDIALEYRIKSLKLCDEINDDTLLWDKAGTSLKVESLGFLYGRIGDCQKQIACFKEGLKIRERITGKINEGYISQLTGIASYINNCMIDYESSLHLNVEALECITELYGKNSLEYYDQLFHLGGSYMDSYLFEKALECYNLCSEFYKENHESEKFHNTQIHISNVYGYKGDYRKSIETLLSLEKEVQESSKSYWFIIHNLAVSYNDLGDHNQALYWYSIENKKLLTQDEKDIQLLLMSYNGIGLTYTGLNKFEDAEKYFNECMNIIHNMTDNNVNLYIPIIVIIYNNLSQLYLTKGDYKLADTILSQLETFYRDRNINNPKILASILGTKADFYAKIFNYTEAIKYNFEAYSILKEYYVSKNLPTNYQADVTLLLNNRAVFLSEIGRYEESMEINKLLLEIREKTLGTYHPQFITTMNNISTDYLNLDSLQQAKYYIEEVLKKDPDNPTYLNNAGLLYQKNCDFLNAEKFFMKAKIIAETKLGKEHPDYLRLLFNLFVLYFDYKKFDTAIPLLNEYGLNTRKQIFSNFSFMSEKQRELYWNDIYSKMNLFYPLLSAYPIPETQQFAYNNALFSKGLLLRSSNEIRDAILNLGNPELITKFETLQALRQQINTLQSKSDSVLVAYTHTLEVKADSLDKALTIASSDYRNLKTDLNLEWEDIRNHLSNNEVAIEFIDYQNFDKQWTDTTMYAALILRKDSKFPEYVPLFEQSQLSELLNNENPDIEKRIQKLYDGRNPRLFNGQKLYNLIWQPLENYLEGVETVYYSPAGLLNRISFSAIPVDTLCLSDRYNLHLVSSTREIVNEKKETLLPITQMIEYGGIQYDIQDSTQLISSAEKYKKPEKEMLASRSLPNDSTRSAGWSYLQGTELEVDNIAKLLQRSNVPNIKYVGVEANEESFKALSGNSPELLHIATHGFFLENEKQIRETGFMQIIGGNDNFRVVYNPLLRAGLLFAGANRAWTNQDVISGIEDGILTAEEIANLNLSKTKLVVLSACETGLGEVNNSEGVFGLQRAFKLAGVETLVMSLWKVDDAATSQFMLTFYQNLLAGKSKLDSFKIAQKQIREQYRNPYYWAAFVMMD